MRNGVELEVERRVEKKRRRSRRRKEALCCGYIPPLSPFALLLLLLCVCVAIPHPTPTQSHVIADPVRELCMYCSGPTQFSSSSSSFTQLDQKTRKEGKDYYLKTIRVCI